MKVSAKLAAEVREQAMKTTRSFLEAARRIAPHPDREAEPTRVVIDCPECRAPHIDEGEWATTRRHKTHQCQSCGHEWRPFPYATVGVAREAEPTGGVVDLLAEVERLTAKHGNPIGTDYEQGVNDPGFRIAGRLRRASQQQEPGQ